MSPRSLAELTEAVTDGHLTPRPDGRFDVSDTAQAALEWSCTVDDWCILQDAHQGDCCEDRETWVSEPNPDDLNDNPDPYSHLRVGTPCMRPWWGVVETKSGYVTYTRPYRSRVRAWKAARERALSGSGATSTLDPIQTPAAEI